MARPKKTEAATVRCVVLRDFWDTDGERQRAGTITDVPVREAMEGATKGSLRLADE